MFEPVTAGGSGIKTLRETISLNIYRDLLFNEVLPRLSDC